MSSGDWPKAWQPRRKHRTSTKRDWTEGTVANWTAGKSDKSQYNKLILDSDDAIKDLELTCVNEGYGIIVPGSASESTRHFYMKRDDLGDYVGACCGELTYYVYAEWCKSGIIHGRPISAKALKDKGIKV